MTIVASLVIGAFALGVTAGVTVADVGVLVGTAYAALLYGQYFSAFGYSRVGLVARSVCASFSLFVLVTLAVAGYLLARR